MKKYHSDIIQSKQKIVNMNELFWTNFIQFIF